MPATLLACKAISLYCLPCRPLENARSFELWTSAIEAQVWRQGLVETHRLDLLLGADMDNSKGIHLITWGTVNTATNTLEMTLGIPAKTLQQAGVRGLQPEYVLPIKITGQIQAPVVDFLG